MAVYYHGGSFSFGRVSVISIRPVFGYVTIAGAFVFLVLAVIHYEYFEKMASAELLSAGFEQGQIQKNLLKNCRSPIF